TSFAVRNFGCRVNQAEAFAWADAFRERGLRLDEDWGRSDVVVVNSCTLTGRAERDVRKFIRAVHRENPGSKIVVTGCYAERAPAEIAALPGVVSVLPQSAKDGMADRVMALDGFRTTPQPAGTIGRQATNEIAGEIDESASFRARGYLKIQDGCDSRCAYCIIPSVRGRSRSVRPEDAAAAVRDLAGRGFREIVLAGIHLSSYGEDLEPRSSLLGLLGELGDAAGPARLRLSSLDPRKTDAGLMTRIAGDERICPHVHLSLQHASRRILGLMGRAVEVGSYGWALEEMARLAPEAALGADILVGFPGETEADFEELREFIERSALTYVHVFSYSQRPGTAAAARPQIPAGVVTERAKALRHLSAMKNFRFRRRFLGRELEAVVIDRSEKGAEVLTGNFISVLVPSCPAPERELVRVSVRRVLPRRTEGEIVP
ncbi:MAG: tRNA (N(6)-L-threonylcarbamoyladenosine(37)-C(2))-methylthiotransferase MtaB, partial [Candidatus Aminicenantales bacterium]